MSADVITERERALAMDRIRRAKSYVGKPRECWCTGACGNDPKNCPYLQKPPPETLAEAVEEVAEIVAVMDPHGAEVLRAIFAEGPTP